MRVKIKGFERGKAYWIKASVKNGGREVDIYVHFKRGRNVYMDVSSEGGYTSRVINKRMLKHLLSKVDTIHKEELSLWDMYNYVNYEDEDWWNYSACENGCCSCCGCMCDMYEEEWDEEEYQ